MHLLLPFKGALTYLLCILELSLSLCCTARGTQVPADGANLMHQSEPDHRDLVHEALEAALRLTLIDLYMYPLCLMLY